MQLAESKALIIDESTIRDARNTLINPTLRLDAEIGWFPGLSPSRTYAILSKITEDPKGLIEEESLPDLARANMLVVGFNLIIEEMNEDERIYWIVEISRLYDEFNIQQIARYINEDRLVAGLPVILDESIIINKLEQQLLYFRRQIESALDKLHSNSIVEILNRRNRKNH